MQQIAFCVVAIYKFLWQSTIKYQAAQLCNVIVPKHESGGAKSTSESGFCDHVYRHADMEAWPIQSHVILKNKKGDAH